MKTHIMWFLLLIALPFQTLFSFYVYGESTNGTVKTSKSQYAKKGRAKVDFKSFVEELCNDDQDCINRNLDAFFIFWKGEQRLLKRLRSPYKYSIEESRKFLPADIADTISIWRQGLLEHIYKRYEDKPEYWFPKEAFQEYLAYLELCSISFDSWKQGVDIVANYYLEKEYYEKMLYWIKKYFILIKSIEEKERNKDKEESTTYFTDLLESPILTSSNKRHESHLRFLQITFLFELEKNGKGFNQEVINSITNTLSNYNNGTPSNNNVQSYLALAEFILRKELERNGENVHFVNEIEYRDAQLMVKKMNLISKGHLLVIAISLFSVFLILVALILCIEYMVKKYLPKQCNNGRKNILYKEENLINLNSMFNSDGRVLAPEWIRKIVECKDKADNEKKIEIDKKFKEKFLEKNVTEEQKDKLALEKLILDGYFLIREANTNFIPYQLRFVSNSIINRLRCIPSWLTHAIFSLLVTSILLIIGCLGAGILAGILNYDQVSLSESLKVSFKSWYFWVMAGLLAGGLELTRYMVMQAIDAIDELVSLLKPDSFDSLRNNPGESSAISMLRGWLKVFLTPHPFLPLLIAFSFIALALFRHYMAGGLLAPLPNMFAFYPLMIITILFTFPVFCLSGASIWFTSKICSYQSLDLNPISPVKTYGLQRLISIIGSYAISLLCFFTPLILMIRNLPLTNIHINPFVSNLYLFILIPFIPFYFLYPHGKLSNLIKKKKREQMRLFQAEISRAFNQWESSSFENKAKEEALEKMNKPCEIFSRIDKTRESFWDFQAALAFLKATAIPFFIGVYQSRNAILKWFSGF